jgi:hypothetical protein
MGDACGAKPAVSGMALTKFALTFQTLVDCRCQ